MKDKAKEFRKTHWYSYDNIKNNGRDLSNLKFYTNLEMDEHGELCRKEVIDNIKAFQKAIPLGKTTASYNTIHELLDYLEELEKKEAEDEK